MKHPRVQQRKQLYFNKLWHSDDWMQENIPSVEEFDYKCFDLQKFTDSHPALMDERIENSREWTQYFDPNRLVPKPLRHKILDSIERITGRRIGEYKNFIEL
ncbi:MAG: hypothetical protein IPM69_05665 [Ignavibacteria bacterium]|nr:hypothetical protein [Ignavibacteria bacterium]